jgi:hypothetical protein
MKNQWDDSFGIVRCAEFYNIIPHWIQRVLHAWRGFHLKQRMNDKIFSFVRLLLILTIFILDSITSSKLFCLEFQ